MTDKSTFVELIERLYTAGYADASDIYGYDPLGTAEWQAAIDWFESREKYWKEEIESHVKVAILNEREQIKRNIEKVLNESN